MSERIKNEENIAKNTNIESSAEGAGDQTALQNDFKKALGQKDIEISELHSKTTEMTSKITNLEHDLQQRTEERENYKNKIQNLESEIIELKKSVSAPNMLSSAQQTEVHKIKKVSEEMLTKAKGIIFDKTKICKNQELQIEALTQQVTSLKEVLGITKDLLEIRNMEVKHLQEKMDCMDAKISAERHRHDLMNKKMEAMLQMNTDLKVEYETQLKLFNALRTSYTAKQHLQDLQKGSKS